MIVCLVSADTYVDEEEEDWLEYLRSSLFAEQEAALHDLDLKVIVPQGLVIAMSKAQPDKVLWKHKVFAGNATTVKPLI